MKNILFLLFPFLIYSQTLPVSEHSAYVYTKYNYGNDLFNVFSVFQKKDGSIICQPYADRYYILSNTSIDKAFSSREPMNYTLFAFTELRGTEYFLSNQKIMVVKNQKLIKEYTLHLNDGQSGYYVLYKGKIYFTDKFTKNKSHYLKAFDGKRFETLMRIPDNICGLRATDKLYCFANKKNTLSLYALEDRRITYIKSYPLSSQDFDIWSFRDADNFSIIFRDHSLLQVTSGTVVPTPIAYPINFLNTGRTYLTTKGSNKITFSLPIDKPLFNTSLGENISNVTYNAPSNSYYCATGTLFFRVFPHITKYPRLFNNTNSNTVFTLRQDSRGKIWAGSYQGALSVIDKDRITESSVKTIQWMNGGMSHKDKMILIGEAGKGVFLFDTPNRYKKIADSVTGFYLYESRNKTTYLGTASQGLWYKRSEDLENTRKNWKRLSYKQGINLANILSISEDRFGNIWMGQQGLAVYNPKTGYAKSWLKIKKETDYGTMAMQLDNHNTLWIGTMNGKLMYYNSKSETDYDLKNLVELRHPLLETGKVISFMHPWKDFLILGVQDKVLLFDLKKWYRNRSVSIRYLNPLETAFSNSTEQNTCLTDNRDGSIWFSTSDMVYHWDIKKWLSLPSYTVRPDIIISKDSTETRYKPNQMVAFHPNENSIDIRIHYQTPDNMPRYLNGILVKKGDKAVFGSPDLQTRFHFANLSAGDYTFFVRICQQDGSYTVFQYPFTIESFLWQKWWFWMLISTVPIVFVIYYFNNKRRINIQQKQIAQLNLSSLSNQFRPHFMLNALNSLGAELEDKPHANKVISRLGESINIMFGFTQSGSFTHCFENEMQMVLNTIDIQRLLYLSELETQISGIEIIPPETPVPIGLLQIAIENALLHGLRNREIPPYLLSLNIQESGSFYIIIIEDNGVGREKAMRINHFKKNGKGLENLEKMIDVINGKRNDNIVFEISDRKIEGTTVTIKIKKNINYENFGL
ncbi:MULTISPECIES: histidine kinase [unclassified Chryseobacterium]|uniref:histidine kinase n=1 Tax=unclassified Chryseobacterium TaxID=2593645 RepID=UPI000D3C404D|nr:MULTISPECIES: histidine kinase [unclassified Chryseobacterium]PTT66768.1 hypothetical protein DBR25_22020 [Chryseobacterium sp. HMWF001]PVV55190.1 hypothetical protein DD829_15540 [Chryseobacterium sp. HMWF035]